MKKTLVIVLLLGSINCTNTIKEIVYPGSVGFILGKNNEVLDSVLIEPGVIDIPSNYTLVTFNLLPDTLIIKGNASLENLKPFIYEWRIIIQLQKGRIIDLYNDFSISYKERFVEPEAKRTIRELYENTSGEIEVQQVFDSLKPILNSRYISLIYCERIKFETQ